MTQSDTSTDTLASAADISTFERDGIVCLRNVLSAEWIRKLELGISADLKDPGPNYYAYKGKGSGKFHGNQEVWRSQEALEDYCKRSPLPSMAAQFLHASHVCLYFDHLFVKEPGAESPTPWHNDQPYWPVGGRQVMSFWTCLDPVTKDSGAVEYVRGSHKWDRWFQPRGFADSDSGFNSYDANSKYEPVPDVEAHRDDYDMVSFDMEPGDVLAFHSLTLHGAGGNLRQDRARRGYAVRYIGEGAYYDPRVGTSKLLWDDGLKAGDPFGTPRFPKVWPNLQKA